VLPVGRRMIDRNHMDLLSRFLHAQLYPFLHNSCTCSVCTTAAWRETLFTMKLLKFLQSTWFVYVLDTQASHILWAVTQFPKSVQHQPRVLQNLRAPAESLNAPGRCAARSWWWRCASRTSGAST
jgi:hypothetical protein